MKLHSSSVVFCAALASGACGVAYSDLGRAEGHFERTLEAVGPVRLEVTTGAGSIEVRAHDADRVEVKAAISVRDVFFDSRRSEDVVRELEKNPPIEQSAEGIRIGRIADRGVRNRASISYQLLVPQRARVQCSTGSGEQKVYGIAGPVDASSGSGRVEIAGTRADVYAETGSGSIRLEDVRAGRVELSTGSGAIDVAALRGKLRAHTGSGSIDVSGEPVERWELETGSGAITADVPEGAGLEVDASTGSGRVTLAQTLSEAAEVKEHRVRGRVGAGGPVLDLRTGSGRIRVE